MAKILIISPSYTHPTTAGNRKCILDYCNMLKSMGHEIYFLLVLYDYADTKSLKETKEYWKDNFILFKTSKFHCTLKHIKNRYRKHFCHFYWKIDDWYPMRLSEFINNIHEKEHFDAAIVNYVYLSKLFEKVKIKNIALYTHDCFIHKSKRIGFNADFTLEPSDESKGLMRCQNILSIQENETQLFKYLAPNSNIFTVYSYFDYFPLPLTGNMNLLFFSGPNIFNINGIKYFIYNIYPDIKKEFNDIKLYIGGKICDELSKWELPSDIILKGEYKNSTNFYKLGDIVINPVYQGTGLKIKTFESLSYGRITIVNEHSCEGVYKKETAPLLIASTSIEYIEHIKKFISIEKRIEHVSFIKKYINSFQEHVKKEFKKALNI